MNLEKLYHNIENLEVENLVSKELKQKILKELEVEIFTKGKTNKSIISAFKRVQKTMEGRKVFQQVFQSNSGNYVVCNGYFLVDYSKNKENVPVELHAYINVITEYQKNDFDYEHLKTKITFIEHRIKTEKLLKIKQYNKLHDTHIPYKLGDKYINADYILDVLTLAGIKKIDEITLTTDEDLRSPFNLELTDNTNAIILPIKYDDEETENRYNKILKEILD